MGNLRQKTRMTTATNAPRRLSIFGSTGSIGQNTLDVIQQLGGRESYEISVVTGNENIELLAQQARSTGARLAVTASDSKYRSLKAELSGSGIGVAAGAQGLAEAADIEADWVMAAIVGTAGLVPTLAAARKGAAIALANKECLVSAGDLFVEAVLKGGGLLIPVDSEHSAIFQSLDENQRHAVERIILTASGGPFRTWSRAEMANVTAATARAHPNWSMGLKISIGSASMFNKALEMIEAKHLFSVRPDQIEVVVHPQPDRPFHGRLHRWIHHRPTRQPGYANGDRLCVGVSAPAEAECRAPGFRKALSPGLRSAGRKAFPRSQACAHGIGARRLARSDHECC